MMNDKYTDTPGYIYFIADGLGHYKIGSANDVTRAVEELQTKSALTLSLAVALFTEDTAMLELYMHNLFKEQRVHDDWFVLSNDDIEYLKSLAGGE